MLKNDKRKGFRDMRSDKKTFFKDSSFKFYSAFLETD